MIANMKIQPPRGTGRWYWQDRKIKQVNGTVVMFLVQEKFPVSDVNKSWDNALEFFLLCKAHSQKELDILYFCNRGCRISA